MGNEDNERELDWNDTIEKDSSDFITLPEGDYDFMVESFDRARHNGSDNLPPCNKAILKIRIDDPAGTVIVTHNLFLHTKVEGLISAFFSSIGQKKKGEQLRMNWALVPGARGRLKLGIRKYQKDGEDRTINEIKKFYPKEVTPSFKIGRAHV